MKNTKQKVVAFLNYIGIKTKHRKIARGSFLPGIRIRNGILLYNRNAIAADLLHEAGHIVTVPSKYRRFCNTDMDKSIRKIWSIAEREGDLQIESTIFRQLIQSSECEAIAWSWAAGKHLGLLEEEIITDNKRHFNGEGAEIRGCLAANSHFGINGLRAGGMLESVKKYPRLTRWVQD